MNAKQIVPSFFMKNVSVEAILMAMAIILVLSLIHFMIGSLPATIIGGITGLYVCWRETSATA
ncbi:hypothetical protein KC711_02915 [Candidatus Peregrinibacteria bacterium]|nr:hypothetical protein [Candidatus Peregrinibacteria bacterium]